MFADTAAVPRRFVEIWGQHHVMHRGLALSRVHSGAPVSVSCMMNMGVESDTNYLTKGGFRAGNIGILTRLVKSQMCKFTS